MKLCLILLALGLAAADKLDRTYLPPPGSKFAGGSPESLQTPLEFPEESLPLQTLGQNGLSKLSPQIDSSTSLRNPLGPIGVGINDLNNPFGNQQGIFGPGPDAPLFFVPNAFNLPTTTSYAFSQTTTVRPTVPTDATFNSRLSVDQPQGQNVGTINSQNVSPVQVYEGLKQNANFGLKPNVAPQYPGNEHQVDNSLGIKPDFANAQPTAGRFQPGLVQPSNYQDLISNPKKILNFGQTSVPLTSVPVIHENYQPDAFGFYGGNTMIMTQNNNPNGQIGQKNQPELLQDQGAAYGIGQPEQQYPMPKYSEKYGDSTINRAETLPNSEAFVTMPPNMHEQSVTPSTTASPTNILPGQTFAANNNGIPTIFRRERPQAESDRNAVILNYDNVITPEGYSYSFDTSNGIHADENGIATNGVRAQGSYSYTGDDGKVYSVIYTADENGFQPRGDHLPTPPPIPEAILRVIEQANRDQAAGISDDGSYDEEKYGYKKYQGAMDVYQPQMQDVGYNVMKSTETQSQYKPQSEQNPVSSSSGIPEQYKSENTMQVPSKNGLANNINVVANRGGLTNRPSIPSEVLEDKNVRTSNEKGRINNIIKKPVSKYEPNSNQYTQEADNNNEGNINHHPLSSTINAYLPNAPKHSHKNIDLPRSQTIGQTPDTFRDSKYEPSSQNQLPVNNAVSTEYDRQRDFRNKPMAQQQTTKDTRNRVDKNGKPLNYETHPQDVIYDTFALIDNNRQNRPVQTENYNLISSTDESGYHYVPPKNRFHQTYPGFMNKEVLPGISGNGGSLISNNKFTNGRKSQDPQSNNERFTTTIGYPTAENNEGINIDNSNLPTIVPTYSSGRTSEPGRTKMGSYTNSPDYEKINYNDMQKETFSPETDDFNRFTGPFSTNTNTPVYSLPSTTPVPYGTRFVSNQPGSIPTTPINYLRTTIPSFALNNYPAGDGSSSRSEELESQNPTTTYRPVSTVGGDDEREDVKVDGFGRPIPSVDQFYNPGTTYIPDIHSPLPKGQDSAGSNLNFGRPSDRLVTPTNVGPTVGVDDHHTQPKEDEQNASFSTPYEIQPSTTTILGEDFSGPKQPQYYDPKTGYHY